jgi:hypothetical protein
MVQNTNSDVQYIDLGINSDKQFWTEIVLPAYERFRSVPNGQHAIEASILAWHALDWMWHQLHPNSNTLRDPGRKEFEKFKAKVIGNCQELALLGDIADASKHCGLTVSKKRGPRKAQTMRQKLRGPGPFNTYAYNTMPFNRSRQEKILTISLKDGTIHLMANVLSHAIDYLQENHFK